jgi:adenine-specific DNA-methyltransferase
MSDSPAASATPFQSKYWATQLALRSAGGSIDQLSGAISNARVDLNPHQVDAALFAVRSPFSKGVILADEVGGWGCPGSMDRSLSRLLNR